MGPGTALLIPSGTPNNPDLKHLYIVCTEPNDDGVVVIVSVSSWKNDLCDGTCILDAGCHDFIQKKSWVMYRAARLETIVALESGVDCDDMIPKPDVDSEVLGRIQAGLKASKHTPWEVKRFVKKLSP